MEVYYFKFRSGYGIRIEQGNFPDAIILAKASAILAGHPQPKMSSVIVNNKDTIYFCSMCGNEVVNPHNGIDTCDKCLNR